MKPRNRQHVGDARIAEVLPDTGRDEAGFAQQNPVYHRRFIRRKERRGVFEHGAAQIQKNVSDATNEMLRQNAAMLEQSTVETARQVERSVVDIETLREVQTRLLSTIEETLNIAREGREKRQAAEQELASMELDLRNHLAGLAAAKTQDVIQAAAGDEQLTKLPARSRESESQDQKE